MARYWSGGWLVTPAPDAGSLFAMIRVISHDSAWKASFTREAARLVAALGETVVRIHHIGSTAIPHTKAKPIIDNTVQEAKRAKTVREDSGGDPRDEE